MLMFFVGACGQTGIRQITKTTDATVRPPSRILVYDFAVSENEVREYQGIMRQEPTVKDPAERERELGRSAADALALELVGGLQKLGFTVERVPRGTPVTGDDLLVDGQFVTVDEGNPLHRFVVGFGVGASKVDTQVQVYQGSDQRKLLAFSTHSDSGKMPGTPVTFGAGAGIGGGVTAGTVLGNAASAGFSAYRSEVARMAANSGDQVFRYLSEFFAKEGWIQPNQVKEARRVY